MVRKCPKKLAKDFNLKTKKRGLDGNMWIVTKKTDGTKYWKKYKKTLHGGVYPLNDDENENIFISNNQSIAGKLEFNNPNKKVTFNNTVHENTTTHTPVFKKRENDSNNFRKTSHNKHKKNAVKKLAIWIIENIFNKQGGVDLGEELIMLIQQVCLKPGLGQDLMKQIEIYSSGLYGEDIINLDESNPHREIWEQTKKRLLDLQGKTQTTINNAHLKGKKIAMSEIKNLNIKNPKQVINPDEIINMATYADHIQYVLVHNKNINILVYNELELFKSNNNITVKKLYDNIHKILSEYMPNRFNLNDIEFWLEKYHQSFFYLIKPRINKEKKYKNYK